MRGVAQVLSHLRNKVMAAKAMMKEMPKKAMMKEMPKKAVVVIRKKKMK